MRVSLLTHIQIGFSFSSFHYNDWMHVSFRAQDGEQIAHSSRLSLLAHVVAQSGQLVRCLGGHIHCALHNHAARVHQSARLLLLQHHVGNFRRVADFVQTQTTFFVCELEKKGENHLELT